MKKKKIFKIKEIRKTEDVNKLLEEGWVIIKVIGDIRTVRLSNQAEGDSYSEIVTEIVYIMGKENL